MTKKYDSALSGGQTTDLNVMRAIGDLNEQVRMEADASDWIAAQLAPFDSRLDARLGAPGKSRGRGSSRTGRSMRSARSRPEGSYLSGHTMVGDLTGLALTQMVPERSAAILARAQQYGQHRVVCGVHYPTDVEASHLIALAMFGAIAASPKFQAGLAAARERRGRGCICRSLWRSAISKNAGGHG